MNATSSTDLPDDDHERDHPAVSVVEIDDPTAVGEEIEIVEQDVVKIQNGRVQIKRIIVRLGGGILVYQSTDISLRSRSRLIRDLNGYITFGLQSNGTAEGIDIHPDLLLAAGPGAAGEFVVDGGYESITFFVEPAKLRKEVENRQLGDEVRMPEGIEVLQSNHSGARRLFDHGKRIVDSAAKQPEVFNEHPNSRDAAYAELLELLLAAIKSSTPFEPTRKGKTKQNQSEIVQKAQAYAVAHASKHYSVSKLCQAARVSERTLQYAFYEIMGMTPIAYITNLRLHRVRQALRESDQIETSVSVEAFQWGFWHLGDFSRAYKNLFGELPSSTLSGTEH